jgi:hypothetical protein
MMKRMDMWNSRKAIMTGRTISKIDMCIMHLMRGRIQRVILLWGAVKIFMRKNNNNNNKSLKKVIR